MADVIGDLTAELHALKTAISEAYQELDEADGEWLPKYDATFETLRDQNRDDGRKSDPAEHVVVSAARKSYPAEYQRWKRAKREIRKLEEVAQSTRSQVSGHQTRIREQVPSQRKQGPRAVAS